MDGEIVLAILVDRELALKFITHGIIDVDLGGPDNGSVQSIDSGLSAQQHLEAFCQATIIGIDHHIVVLASLELEGHGHQIVIGGILRVIIVIGVITIIPIPGCAIAIGIDYRKDIKSLVLGQIGGIGHIECHDDFHSNHLALVASALVVVGHHLVIVNPDCQVITIVNKAERSAGSHVLERVDYLAVTQELNLVQIGRQGLAIAFHSRSREIDCNLKLLLGLDRC